MNRSLMARAQNSAAANPVRRQAFDAVLQRADVLEDAAKEGKVPVASISGSLLRILGGELVNPSLKQFIGLCVVAILEERGYSVVRPRVRLRDDPVFGVGALFSRWPTAKRTVSDTLLQRFVDALSPDELLAAEKLVRARLTLSRSRASPPKPQRKASV